jgi:hypothetical protein
VNVYKIYLGSFFQNKITLMVLMQLMWEHEDVFWGLLMP